MLQYLTRRIIEMVPLLFFISALIYLLLYLMPGDPLYSMLEDVPNLRPEDYKRLRTLYGLDDPVYVQYWKWLWQVLQLKPGYSREYGQPVLDVILPALKNTLVLTLTAVVLGKFLAVLLGIFSAIRQYSIGDYLLTALTFMAYSVPAFWTVVETVFGYPGMGRLLYTSIMGNDFVVAMTVVMIIAVTVVLFNLLADILYGWLDPRIRYQG